MIDRADEKTKGGESRPATVLRFLFGLVGVVVITISELLLESACSRYLRFALVVSWSANTLHFVIRNICCTTGVAVYVMTAGRLIIIYWPFFVSRFVFAL